MPPGLFIKRRAVWLSCIFATTLALGWIFWPASVPIAEPLPSPNGYDDFVKAAKLIVRAPDPFPEGNELRTHIANNQEALRLIRKALTYEWRQPTNREPAYPDPLERMAHFNAVTELMSDEHRLAKSEGKADPAMVIYIDLLRLSQLFPIGGLLPDKNLSLLFEESCLSDFEELEPTLTAISIRTVIKALLQMETPAEPQDKIITRQRALLDTAWSFQDRMDEMWKNKTMFPSHDFMSIESDFIDHTHRTARLRRQLMVRLATHLYQREKGTPPRQMSDLVPDILPTIPVDPETGTNLVLNPSK